MALFVIAIAGVSAGDVSDISIDQNVSDSSNLLTASDVGAVSSDCDDSISAEDSLSNEMDSSTVSSKDSKALSASSSTSDVSNAVSASSSTDDDSLSAASKNATVISSSTKTVVRGDYFNITLKDKNTNKILSNKTVTFTFNGKTYNKTTNSNGIASLALSAKANKYAINCSFAGDSNYQKTSQSFTVTVNKTPTTLSGSGSSSVRGKAYKVTLKDKKGNPVSGKKITLVFNAKTYTRTTNSNGQVSLSLSAAAGKTYKLTYKFAGDSYYAASSASSSVYLKMATTLTGSGSTIVKGNTYKVTLKDGNSKVLSSKKVTFTINGKTYNRTTDSKGVAGLKINANSGKTYKLSYKYAGTKYYEASSGSVSLFVKTPTTLTGSGSSIVSGKSYVVTLKDINGNLLSNKTVKFTFNSKTYSRTTNTKGQASLKISGSYGKTYKLAYKFAGDSKYGPSSGSVNLKVKKATTVTGSGSSIIKGNAYKVTLKDSSGTLLSNKTITFTLSGKAYKKTTNSKGVASLTINAAGCKSYSFSYSYGGSSYYAPSSSGTFKLTVKDSTKITNSGSSIMNGTYYKLVLKDSSSKPVSNKTIVIGFNGKTYDKVTDGNGAVGLKIEVSTPKTYKMTYKFAGDSDYGPSSGSVNINVKSYTVFTIAQIISASKTFKSYVVKNSKVPSTVSVNGVTLNFTSFTYLMGKAVVSINNNKTSGNINLVTVHSNYSNSGSNSINGNLYKPNYIDMANKLISFTVSNKAIPYYINTSLGKISPNLYSYGLAKALVFYSTEKYLPNYLIMSSSDVSGNTPSGRGNASQFKKGLNEKATLNASQKAAYLASSGHDALNSAIKTLAAQLVAGKTSTWAKATAIFNYVRDDISYSYYANSVKSATGTLSSKAANCCDQANLVVALCRAANIPARFSHGQGCTFSSGLVTGHVWAQIYIDGYWYSADATSSRNSLGNIHNWNTNSFHSLKQYAHLPF